MEETRPSRESGATPPMQAHDDGHRMPAEEEIFVKFDAYPWAEDAKFLGLLNGAAKGGTQAVDWQKARLARTLYFTRILGVPLDLESYARWLSSHPEHEAPDSKLAAMFGSPESPTQAQPPRPSWQVNAPKEDLFVEKSAQNPASSSNEPVYPSKFAELIQCIQEGRPVPGIREIPSTLARDPSVKPFGSCPAPKKPWEKDMADTGRTEETPSEPMIDQEFPSLESITHVNQDDSKSVEKDK